MVLPFAGALDFFLGFWSVLPQPFQSFISAVFFFFFLVALIRIFRH